MADSIDNITEQLSKVNVIGMHQLQRNGNKAVYLELLPILGKEDSQICRMNSSDYLALNGHPSINEATIKAINKFGTGRNGNLPFGGETSLHIELESELKDLYGAEACMITPNGTLSNFNVMYALAAMGYCDTYFSDQSNHATIISGIHLAQTANKSLTLQRYRHLDYQHLESQLIEYRKNNPKSPIVIVTDGIFSMEGTIANAEKLTYLAEKYDSLLVFDECHSMGVIGERGGGTLEYNKVPWNKRIIITGTFGKAVPCNGGFIIASEPLLMRVFKYGRFSMFCGTMTPPDCAVATASLKIIKNAKRERERLHSLVKIWRNLVYNIYIKYNFPDDKYAIFYRENMDNPSPIVPFYLNLPNKPIKNIYKDLHTFCLSLVGKHRLLAIPVGHPAVAKGEELVRILLTLETNETELIYWAKSFDEEYKNLIKYQPSKL